MHHISEIYRLNGMIWLLILSSISATSNGSSKTPILTFSNALEAQGKVQLKCKVPTYDGKTIVFLRCPLTKGYCMMNCSMICTTEVCKKIKSSMNCIMEYSTQDGIYYVMYTFDGTNTMIRGNWICSFKGSLSNTYNIKHLIEKPKTSIKPTKLTKPSTTAIVTTTKRQIVNGNGNRGNPYVLPPHKKSTDLNSIFSSNSLLHNNHVALIVLLFLGISLFGNVVLGCRFICGQCSYKKDRRENGGGLLSRMFSGTNSCHDDEKFSTLATHPGNHHPQMMNSLYVTHPANQFRLQQQSSQLNCSEQNTIYDDTSLVVGFQGNTVAGNIPLPPPPLLSRIQNGSGHYVAPSSICPPTPHPPQQSSTPSPSDAMHNNEVYVPMRAVQNHSQSTSSSALQMPLQINPVSSSNHDNTTSMNSSHSNTIQYTNFIPDPTAAALQDQNQIYLSFYTPHQAQQPMGTPHFMYACNSTNHLPISPNMSNGTINPHPYNNQPTNQNHSSLQSLNNLRNTVNTNPSTPSNQPITTTTNENGEPQNPTTNQNGDILNGRGSINNDEHNVDDDDDDENHNETSKLMLEKTQRLLQSADSYLNSSSYNKT